MHEAHGGGAEDLRVAEKAVGPPPVQPGAYDGEQLADQPAGPEAQQQAHHKAVQDLDPLGPVDAGQAVVDGNGRAGQPGDQAVAFGCGDAEVGRPHAVHHDGEQRRTQRDEGFLGVAAEIHHVGDGGGDRRIDVGHDQHAEEVEPGAEQDGRPHPHTAGADAGGDGVGGVGPAVDKDDPQREHHSDQQHRAAGHLLEKVGQRYIHGRVSLIFVFFFLILFWQGTQVEGGWLPPSAGGGAFGQTPPFLSYQKERQFTTKIYLSLTLCLLFAGFGWFSLTIVLHFW